MLAMQADYSHILRSLLFTHPAQPSKSARLIYRHPRRRVSRSWVLDKDIDHQAAMSKRGFDGLSLIAKEQMCDREIDEGLI